MVFCRILMVSKRFKNKYITMKKKQCWQLLLNVVNGSVLVCFVISWYHLHLYTGYMGNSLWNCYVKFVVIFYFRKIHILGSFKNIKIARTAICSLILGIFLNVTFIQNLCILLVFDANIFHLLLLGSPPSKVYGNMRAVAARSSERIWLNLK